MNAFSDCSLLETAVINAPVTKIEAYAYARCGSLKSVTLPETLASIGDQAFIECPALAELTIPASVREIGSEAFSKETCLLVHAGSCAEQFAKENGYVYRII
jgi:hypothetical protein